jgi:CMP-N-acetylneuraminic acid synthetase
LKLDEDGKIESYFPESELKRTQDFKKSYHDAGQFYWGSKTSWLSNARIHSNATGLIVPAWRAVDFDTEEDWIRGEILFKLSLEGKGA